MPVSELSPAHQLNDQIIIKMKYHWLMWYLAGRSHCLKQKNGFLVNLFDWLVNQIIQRRKLFTRCTSIHLPENRIKIPPWPSFPPPSAPPWTASAPLPSPAPSVQRESASSASTSTAPPTAYRVSATRSASSASAPLPSPVPSAQRE